MTGCDSWDWSSSGCSWEGHLHREAGTAVTCFSLHPMFPHLPALGEVQEPLHTPSNPPQGASEFIPTQSGPPTTMRLTWYDILGAIQVSAAVGHCQVGVLLALLPMAVANEQHHQGHYQGAQHSDANHSPQRVRGHWRGRHHGERLLVSYWGGMVTWS